VRESDGHPPSLYGSRALLIAASISHVARRARIGDLQRRRLSQSRAIGLRSGLRQGVTNLVSLGP
jgi:hypothetical protein